MNKKHLRNENLIKPESIASDFARKSRRRDGRIVILCNRSDNAESRVKAPLDAGVIEFSFFTQGFTLFELLIVLVIIALASALIVPRMGGNEFTRLQAEVREAVAVLNYARRMATIQGQLAEVKLYGVPKNSNKQKPPQPGQWISKGAEIHSTQINNKQTDNKKVYEVTFYPGGGSSGGEFVFKRKSFEIKVAINPITGKVTTETTK
ncbi:prepilin-type N-terminal cleavage/methylation domain-containing protein [Candidatus Venteria ishoeyi]|uniref:prepilin-type N-terminal cleavage/methylation domain-containing protein n=1 Tax=Candidatus Venteria ishoeyi TaxID=1899563 RepID=UPI0025A64745|nr:prepilin-type N-terminal cleavage/methylation domain-containing protein [Candidatus Venteria ishoeyi]MDM8547801.1 prepilin-type N-terminal cleavage/methylation domain-containing protein [Candidatus Venteria ishoeyi]